MSKVLYISHSREGSGWAQAAIDYMLALDRVGVEIVSRPIKLNKFNGPFNDRILELEQGKDAGCTHCIQHVLPHFYDYQAGLKNIGLCVFESDTLKYTGWLDYIEMMDEIWVPSTFNKEVLVNDGITVPIKVVPHTTDLRKYEQSYKPLLNNHLDSYVFYFVGEMNRRKNLTALIKAFHLEFDPSEPVDLVVKSLAPNAQSLKEFCDGIKNGLKLYPRMENYKQEILIPGFLTEEQLWGLHLSCHCIVAPSYSEAWNIPVMDALGFGNSVIASKYSGFLEYLDGDNSWLVDGHMEPTFGMNDSLPNLYSGRENWFSVDVTSLRANMRAAYDEQQCGQTLMPCDETIYNLSYEKVGGQMLDLLV